MQSEGSSRVTNTLLTELDGLNDRKGVYVIAATNRPEIIDPAMIRPGRLDHPLFVALPTPEERVEILTALTSKTPLSEDMDLRRIALDDRAANFRYIRTREKFTDDSGADLSALVRQAATFSLRKLLLTSKQEELKSAEVTVGMDNFEEGLNSVRPSVTEQRRQWYERLRTQFDVVR